VLSLDLTRSVHQSAVPELNWIKVESTQMLCSDRQVDPHSTLRFSVAIFYNTSSSSVMFVCCGTMHLDTMFGHQLVELAAELCTVVNIAVDE
jgi:hypothetical protein